MSGAEFTVAILIGGDSSRMGSDKATYEVDGVPMATRVANAAVSAGASEVLLVGSTQAKSKKLSGTWKKDSFPGEGPMGTICYKGSKHTVADATISAVLFWLEDQVALEDYYADECEIYDEDGSIAYAQMLEHQSEVWAAQDECPW